MTTLDTNTQPIPQKNVLIPLKDAQDTQKLGRTLESFCRLGDCLFLIGDLGAGKTTFARGFIQAALARVNSNESIPSPTFTIVQEYDQVQPPIAHFDLYRIEDESELEELGLDDALEGGITLIEWPDRLGDYVPTDRLEVCLALTRHQADKILGHSLKSQPSQPNDKDRTISLAQTSGRFAVLRGFGQWAERLSNALAEGQLDDFELG